MKKPSQCEKPEKSVKIAVFGTLVAKVDIETPLERFRVANYVGCTKNQPKRLHLRPFRGTMTKVCACSDVSDFNHSAISQ